MFVKVVTKYHDIQLNEIVPQGVILEVTEARAEVLKAKGKVVEFKMTATEPKPKPAKEAKEEVVATPQPKPAAPKATPAEEKPAEK